MGLLAWTFLAVAGLVAVAVAAGGYLYATDYAMEATVKEKSCAFPITLPDAQNQVAVRTKVFSIDHTVTDVSDAVCGILRPGNFVEYHIRSGRTVLYESEGGDCLWDSESGPC